MKIKFLLTVFTLSLGLMISCSDDDGDDGTPKGKRLTKIEELDGDGDYKKFSYDSNGRLISIEDGDEDGLQEKVTIAYDGQSISKIQMFDPELYATQNFTYKEDSVFISGEDLFRGSVNDTLIINISSGTLQKFLNNRTITYSYDEKGNILSTSYRSDKLSYDTNPSFYSTTGVPYWFLNYLYETTDFMEDYAGTNNILSSSYNGVVNGEYSYEYDKDGYPIVMIDKDLDYEEESRRLKIIY